jgi:hypothetical protein
MSEDSVWKKGGKALRFGSESIYGLSGVLEPGLERRDIGDLGYIWRIFSDGNYSGAVRYVVSRDLMPLSAFVWMVRLRMKN